MSYGSLQVYYKTIWSMVHHHGWTVSEIENLIPYERDIYVELTSQYLQEQESAAQAKFSL